MVTRRVAKKVKTKWDPLMRTTKEVCLIMFYTARVRLFGGRRKIGLRSKRFILESKFIKLNLLRKDKKGVLRTRSLSSSHEKFWRKCATKRRPLAQMYF